MTLTNILVTTRLELSYNSSRRVGHEDEESGLQDGEVADVSELRDEGREAGHHRPHEEGCPEDPDELSDGLEEDDMGGQRGLLGERLFVVLQGSGDDDGHGVVENALAEH